jgi:hypothetical protein
VSDREIHAKRERCLVSDSPAAGSSATDTTSRPRLQTACGKGKASTRNGERAMTVPRVHHSLKINASTGGACNRVYHYTNKHKQYAELSYYRESGANWIRCCKLWAWNELHMLSWLTAYPTAPRTGDIQKRLQYSSTLPCTAVITAVVKRQGIQLTDTVVQNPSMMGPTRNPTTRQRTTSKATRNRECLTHLFETERRT